MTNTPHPDTTTPGAYCPDHDEPMDRWVRADRSVWWVCDLCGAWPEVDVTVIPL